MSGPVVSGPVVSGPVVSGPVVSGPVVSGPVVSGPVVSGPVVSRAVVSREAVGPELVGPAVVEGPGAERRRLLVLVTPPAQRPAAVGRAPSVGRPGRVATAERPGRPARRDAGLVRAGRQVFAFAAVAAVTAAVVVALGMLADVTSAAGRPAPGIAVQVPAVAGSAGPIASGLAGAPRR